jgi:ferrochelatase
VRRAKDITVKSKLAVVLFNLGGPDGPRAVRPFLENLFSDPAIIPLPWLVRRPLAALVARLRNRSAQANYARMGGASPLLVETRAQAAALEAALRARLPQREVRVFIAMRYWRPTTDDTVRDVEAFAPDEVILTPLYPQFSTTTTGSSISAWAKAWRGRAPVRTLCCWFENEGLIEAHARRIEETWEEAGRPRVRLLFSAHGLPMRTVAGGDPYPWQIEATCAAVAARLGSGRDWQVCYQSRVGPMKWLGPSTPEAILAAARDGVGVLIDPIAFVSDHVETLVELDHDYARLARAAGMTTYLRAPVAGVFEPFIDGLAGAVIATSGACGTRPDGRGCPASFTGCAARTAGEGGAC